MTRWAKWIVLMMGLALCGCGASTPFTAEGIAAVLKETTPIILELAEGLKEGPSGGPTDVRNDDPGGGLKVTVVIVNPARDVWRLPLGHLLHFDFSQEHVWIVVPGESASRRTQVMTTRESRERQ